MRFEELWLLEVVIGAHPPWDGWIPFYGLTPDEPCEMGTSQPCFGNQADINFSSHQMSLETLVEELTRLFASGEIIATHLGYNHSQPTRLFIPSREEIVAGLTRGTRHPWLCYTLTEKGLERWEDYAKPNWSVHLQQRGISGCGDLVSALAASADVARSWIEYARGNGCGFFQRAHWNRAIYQFVRPWKPFPFKTLASGVHVIVPISRGETPDEEVPDGVDADELRESLLDGIDPWFRHGVATWEENHEGRR